MNEINSILNNLKNGRANLGLALKLMKQIKGMAYSKIENAIIMIKESENEISEIEEDVI